jgi:hypothetical protein
MTMKEERAPATEPEAEAIDQETLAVEGEVDGETDGETLLDLVLAEHRARPAPEEPAKIDGIVIARLASLREGGELAITLPWSREPIAARSMAAIGEGDLGGEVAVLFEGGDPRRPVVMGRMHVAAPAAERATPSTPEASPAKAAPTPSPDVEADGERLVFSAEKEIVLRCGQSSITLTRAGKILIRGAYVLTRSSGVNRIQGGSVQIN